MNDQSRRDYERHDSSRLTKREKVLFAKTAISLVLLVVMSVSAISVVVTDAMTKEAEHHGREVAMMTLTKGASSSQVEKTSVEKLADNFFVPANNIAPANNPGQASLPGG